MSEVANPATLFPQPRILPGCSARRMGWGIQITCRHRPDLTNRPEGTSGGFHGLAVARDLPRDLICVNLPLKGTADVAWASDATLEGDR